MLSEQTHNAHYKFAILLCGITPKCNLSNNINKSAPFIEKTPLREPIISGDYLYFYLTSHRWYIMNTNSVLYSSLHLFVITTKTKLSNTTLSFCDRNCSALI